jgi:hypothetical protein
VPLASVVVSVSAPDADASADVAFFIFKGSGAKKSP